MKSRYVRWLVAFVVTLAILWTGCGSNAGDVKDAVDAAQGGEASAAQPAEPASEDTPAEPAEQPAEPAPEQPAEPEQPIEPAPEQPTATPDETDGDSNTQTLIVILIIVGLALGVIAIVASTRSRSGRRAQTGATAMSSSRQLLGDVQWIHDQLSLELLASPGPQAVQRWQTQRSRVDATAIGCQQEAARGGGQPWQELAGSVSSLASALDTALSLGSDPGADPNMVCEAVDIANQRRGEMMRIAQIASQTA
jgi:hypothetical protein